MNGIPTPTPPPDEMLVKRICVMIFTKKDRVKNNKHIQHTYQHVYNVALTWVVNMPITYTIPVYNIDSKRKQCCSCCDDIVAISLFKAKAPFLHVLGGFPREG